MLDEIIKYLEKERTYYAKEARQHFRTYRLTEKRYSGYYDLGMENQEKKKQIRKYIEYLKGLKEVENGKEIL